MKKLLIGAFALLFAHNINAQSGPAALADRNETTAVAPKTITTTTTTTTTAPSVFITTANQWQHIEMKTSGDRFYFTNTDGLSALKVYVTNSDGVEKMQVKLTAGNAVNCKKLKAGLYFVTLVNENTDEKRAFTLTRE